MDKTYYKTRLRPKGQITVPPQIRSLFGVGEGDDLLFSTDENGRVVVSRAQVIPPEQAWFWSERWQQLEREAEADLANGRVTEHADLSSALNSLDALAIESDAEDYVHPAVFKEFCAPADGCAGENKEADRPTGRKPGPSSTADQAHSRGTGHL